jgi:hypothetical protein
MLIELPNFHRPTTIDYFLQKKTLGKSFLDWKLSIMKISSYQPVHFSALSI